MPTQYPFSTEDYLLVGTVVKAHGIKGELKVAPVPGFAGRYENYSRLALVAEDGRMTALLNLNQSRYQGRLIILKLDTIDTKSEADLTAGMGVLIHRNDLPELSEDEFHQGDIEGLPVRLVDNDTVIGIVGRVMDNGAHLLLVVENNGNEYLIPMVKEIIKHVSSQEIIIDPPPGLLEINETDDQAETG